MTIAKLLPAIEQPVRPDTFFKRTVRTLSGNIVALLGGGIVLLMIAATLLAPWVAPYDPISQSLADSLQAPSSRHLLGTDTYGRDILSRIIWGGRSSLKIGFFAVLIGSVLGTAIGVISAYLGGLWDTLIMRITDAFITFPIFLLALIVIATLGPGELNVILAIGVSTIPRFTRVVRAQALVIMKEEYILAAHVIGCSSGRILIRHILPNVAATTIDLFTIYLATAILSEASLSFLGLGTQPPTPSWGLMIASSRGMLLTAPWAILFPSLALSLTVLGLNLFGDGLRDALDPTIS